MNIRLQQFISAENITQAEFADSLGVARASISHILSGRNKPGYEFISSLMLRYPNLSIDWLINGQGKMYKNSEKISPVQAQVDLFSEKKPQQEAPHNPQVPQEASESLFEPETQQKNADKSPAAPDISIPVQPTLISQRKAKKIVIFFDDGTYQEMQA